MVALLFFSCKGLKISQDKTLMQTNAFFLQLELEGSLPSARHLSVEAVIVVSVVAFLVGQCVLFRHTPVSCDLLRISLV